MPRLKWVELKTDLSLKLLAEKIMRRQYQGHECPIGFELLSVSSKYVKARFIQEQRITEVEIDPFGREVRNDLLRYSYFEFAIVRVLDKTLIRFHSPPRSLKEFVTALSAAVDDGVVLRELVIDIAKFLESLKLLGEIRKIKARSAVFSDVPLTKNSKLKVLVSSSGDAVGEFRSKIEGGKLDRVSVDMFNSDNVNFQLKISCRATLSYDDDAELPDFEVLDGVIAEQVDAFL